MSSYLIKAEIGDDDLNLEMVHKMDEQNVWSAAYLTNLKALASYNPDPVFLYSGLSTFSAHESKINSSPICGAGIPTVAYWTTFVDQNINTISSVSITSEF